MTYSPQLLAKYIQSQNINPTNKCFPIVGRINTITIYIYIQLQHIPPMYIFVLNIFWQQLYAVFACRICDFRVPIFQGPNLPHQHFPGAQFAGAQFAAKGPDLPGPNLPGPNLPGPNLPPSNFPGPNLPYPKFSGA